MSVTIGGTAPKPCSSGGSNSASAGSAGMVMTFSTFHSLAVAEPAPDRAGEISGADHDAEEAPVGVRIVRGRTSSAIWCSAPRSTRCRCRPSARSQKWTAWPYLLPSSNSGTTPSSIIDGRAPLAGDQHVAVQVPPGVVGQVLRPVVGLPRPDHVERVVVEQRDPGLAVRLLRRPAEAGQEHPVRTAVQRMRPRVTRFVRQLGRLDRLHEPGLLRIGLGVQDEDVRRADTGHQQVTPGQVAHVVALVLQRARAGVPAEVVQLLAGGTSVQPTTRP